MEVIIENYSYFLKGFQLTIILSISIISGSLVLGTILALCRTSKKAFLKYPVSIYVDFMRSVPLIMVLFWFYFFLPILTGRQSSSLSAILLSMISFISTFYAEAIRSGIQSIPKGHREAAWSTGLSYSRTMLHIILPQAFKKMIPALVGLSIETIKSTAIVYLVGGIDFFRAATIINNREFKSYEIYTFVAVVYFAICFSLSLSSRKYEMPMIEKSKAMF